MPLIERDYGELFDRNCSIYGHYLDTDKDGLGLIDNKPVSSLH